MLSDGTGEISVSNGRSLNSLNIVLKKDNDWLRIANTISYLITVNLRIQAHVSTPQSSNIHH